MWSFHFTYRWGYVSMDKSMHAFIKQPPSSTHHTTIKIPHHHLFILTRRRYSPSPSRLKKARAPSLLRRGRFRPPALVPLPLGTPPPPSSSFAMCLGVGWGYSFVFTRVCRFLSTCTKGKLRLHCSHAWVE